MQSVRNAFRKIYEPGTAFLLEGHENPGNLRRAIAYGGDIGGSLILAPLIAGTGASIGGALYNTAVPEPMEIPTQTLADLVSLGAMGYGGYRALNRFNNAGGWSGLQGKFGRGESVGRETIVSPASVDAPASPPAGTVADDPWKINPEDYSSSNDYSVWGDPPPPSAPSYSAPRPLAVSIPPTAPPSPPYSAPLAQPASIPPPFTGIVLRSPPQAQPLSVPTPIAERNLRNVEALGDPAPFPVPPASTSDFEALGDPAPFPVPPASTSDFEAIPDPLASPTETPFSTESMKNAVIVDPRTVFEKPPYVSQADWDGFSPDIQRTVSEEWFNSSPAEQEIFALFSPNNWGTIKGI